MDPVVWALADAKRCGGTFWWFRSLCSAVRRLGIDARQPRSDQSRFRSHKTLRSRKKRCSSSSSNSSGGGSGSDPDTQTRGIGHAPEAMLWRPLTALFSQRQSQTKPYLCKPPQPRPNCDCLWYVGILRLRVPFFAGDSRDGAVRSVRSVGRGNRSIILAGRQKWGRSTGANVSEAHWNSNKLQASREARGGRSRERVLSSVVRSSTANAAEGCWHGRSAQRSSNERETETDRAPTTRKTMQRNPSRGNIWAIEPERVAGVAGDSYRAQQQ